MAQPTLSDVHVNIPLTTISIAFMQAKAAFVADRVFPVVPVPYISDRYYLYTRADWNRNLMAKRAPGAESAGGGYNLDNTGNYLCDVWSLHKDIPDQVRANSDTVLSPDLEATDWLALQTLISKEVNWASIFFTTSVWTNQWSGVTATPNNYVASPTSPTQVLKWSDPSSTPVEDVRAMKRYVQLSGGGFRPNKIVLSRSVKDTLLDHPDIIDRMKAGQTPGGPALANDTALAQIFELDEVLTMDSIQNTAGEGAGAAPGAGEGGTPSGTAETNAFIAGNNALLVYTPAAPGLMTPAAGYNFSWNGLFGTTTMGTRMKSFYMNWKEVTRTEVDAAYVYKLVSADLGGFFSSVV